jgi:hypothetical protein
VDSDSSNVVARNYERINAAGKRLMAQRQSQSVVFIMDQILRSCDAPIIFHAASLMDDTLQHLVYLSEDAGKQKKERRDEFEKHLSWFTYLPGWFVHYAPTFKTHTRLRRWRTFL